MSLRALQRRVKRIEEGWKPRPSPIVIFYGSWDAFVDGAYAAVSAGALDAEGASTSVASITRAAARSPCAYRHLLIPGAGRSRPARHDRAAAMGLRRMPTPGREPVLDADASPPRVVRKVGWQRCMKCRRPSFRGRDPPAPVQRRGWMPGGRGQIQIEVGRSELNSRDEGQGHRPLAFTTSGPAAGTGTPFHPGAASTLRPRAWGAAMTPLI
ncbi:hypothetical protein HNP60_002968 [Sphingobium sp. B1D3A]|uniref:Uncharacterized protein n=1 Tax=Sphingobium lignivorans TaxID=2735886 RepID=A0ABR6NLD0_9SPHN|nr:hypothetical protein [Sphingobium lignivorans]